MALPTIHPVTIMDRTDTLIMLDRTGGTGTGPVAIGGTIDFRAVDKSRAQSFYRRWRSNFALRLGLRGEFDGLLDCDQQAALVRLARACDIEGRAVIDGGADNWQADRDIHSGLDAEHLHWAVPLVVIHGYDDVKLAAPGAKEKRIGGQRPFNIPASGPTGLDSRFDL
jgi:hypothetical protein